MKHIDTEDLAIQAIVWGLWLALSYNFWYLLGS